MPTSLLLIPPRPLPIPLDVCFKISYTRSRDWPGRTQQTGIFCGKALLLTSSGAREQESKRTREQESKSKSARARARALLLTSLGARAQESKREGKSARVQELYCLHLQEPESKSKRENGETPSLLKENYPPPRTCHSLIGCSPSAELSSRGRQSTWSGELPLAHTQIICLPLKTQDVSAIL